jgi:hypothetical protein
MATIGQQLTVPEAGWKRYDNTHPAIKYVGSWGAESNAAAYNGSVQKVYQPSGVNPNEYVEFKFVGTKIRIIARTYSNQGTDAIELDGVKTVVNTASMGNQWQTLIYEATGLEYKVHTVKFYNETGQYTSGLDAIDIDDTGYLVAQVGQQLTSPEPGWKRYDDTHPAIKYTGSGWNTESNAVHYNSIIHWSRTIGDKIRFKFKGTKIRIITDRYTNRLANSQSITIDGVKEYINTYGTTQGQTLLYEKTGLEDTIHEVELQNETDLITLDAIDIDDTGRLLHPDEVTDIADLDVGKRIRCHYQASSGQVGTFSGLGQETSDFIPPASSATPNGDFYFICVDKDHLGRWKLIADRNIQHSISWDTLNSAGIAAGSGLPIKLYFTEDLLDPNGNIQVISSYPEIDPNALIDNDPQSTWATYSGSTGWISYDFGVEKKIEQYTITALKHNSSLINRTPKDWKFEGWNGSSWEVLHQVSGQTGWSLGEKRTFTFINNKGYTKYRLNVTANNGGDLLQFAELEMMEADSFSKYAFTIRLLTGGINSGDKENEWDKYIVSSTLNETITAGDNNVWNWNSIASWTSTTPSGLPTKRVDRGYSSASNYGNIRNSNFIATYEGFRPVLLIESLYTPTVKYLFEDNGEVKKYVKHNPYALSFNGIDSYVSLPSLLTGFTTFTFEAWIKTTQNTSAANRWNDPAIFGTVQSAGDSQDFFISNYNGKLAWYDELGGGFYDTGALIADGTWKHIAVVRNGGTVTFYVNGNQVGSRTISATETTSKQLEIGRAYYSGSMYFNGLIDEVRLWNTARTLSEIQSHMNKSLSGTELGLIGYWKFDEGSGTTAIDKTANANNGTINGATWTTDTPNTSEYQWKSIGTAPVTESMFLTDGMDDLSIIDDNALQQLESDTPKLLMYTDDTNKTSASVNLTAVPKGQLIFQEGDIDVSAGVESLSVNATVQNSSVLKIIASVDGGTTWKTFDGTAWQFITPDAANVKANGMTPSVVNGLTKEQINDLLQDSNTLRFAYYLEQDQLSDIVNVDDISIAASPVATETPTLDSIKVVYDELTIEGRMQDLERINAINMAKLQFKSNALLQSGKYELHDLVVDTFETSDGVDSTNTNAVYNATNKEFAYDTSTGAPAVQEVVLQEEDLPVYRKKFMLHADHDGNIDYEYSLDGGVTWNPITPFTIVDLTGQTGTNLKVKAKLKDSTAKLRGIAFSWA